MFLYSCSENHMHCVLRVGRAYSVYVNVRVGSCMNLVCFCYSFVDVLGCSEVLEIGIAIFS